MAEQELTGGGQPSKPRRPRRDSSASKTPANEARSAAKRSARASNGRSRTAARQLEKEGLFEPGEAPFRSEEGLFEPGQEIRAPRGQAAAGAPPPPLGSPKLGRRVIHVSWARFWIALIALAILAFVVVASFVTLWLRHAVIDDLTRVLEIFFAPLIALVGVAVAFYYYRGKGEPPS